MSTMNIFPVAIGVLIIGIFIFSYFVQLFYRWRRVRNWSHVTGKLIHTGFKEGMLVMPARITTYTPIVKYEYDYAGHKYTGSRITFRDKRLAFVEKEKAQAILDKIEQNPYVFVNPSHPQNSYLTNEIGWLRLDYLLTYMIAGVLLSLIGCGLLFLSIATIR